MDLKNHLIYNNQTFKSGSTTEPEPNLMKVEEEKYQFVQNYMKKEPIDIDDSKLESKNEYPHKEDKEFVKDFLLQSTTSHCELSKETKSDFKSEEDQKFLTETSLGLEIEDQQDFIKIEKTSPNETLSFLSEDSSAVEYQEVLTKDDESKPDFKNLLQFEKPTYGEDSVNKSHLKNKKKCKVSNQLIEHSTVSKSLSNKRKR